MGGEVGNFEWLREPFDGPVQRLGDPRLDCRSLVDRSGDELGLAAIALWREHKSAGDPVRDVCAVVAADEVEPEVESGCASGRGQQLAVVHEQDVGHNGDRGMAGPKVVGVAPVRGCFESIEKSGGC